MSATLVTDYLFEAKPRWSGTIGSGGVAASNTTTIPLASAANLDNGDAYVFVVNRVTSAGVKNELSAMETVIGELSGTNFINCVRGQEGTAQAWDAGTVVEILFTATHWNKLITAWEVAHNQNGTHKSGLALPSPVITTPQINDTSADHQYILGVSELTADRTITLPLLTAADEFVFQAHGLTTSANSNFTYHSMARQAIINGDCKVSQRGTSFTAPATGAYTLDRYAVVHSSDAVVDIKQTADAPTVAESGVYTVNCLHADVTTLDATIATGQYYFIQYRAEGYDIAPYGFGQAGTRYATLSFWAKHTKTGVYCVAFRNSAVDRSYVAEYTMNTTNTWEKKTITFPIDTSGTWLYTSGIGLNITWAIAVGATFQTTANTWTAGNYFATANQVNGLDSASNDFKITNIELNAGSVALPFQPKSYEDEETACERYCQAFVADQTNGTIGAIGIAFNTAGAQLVLPLRRRMRTVPTLTATASDWKIGDSASSTDVTAMVLASAINSSSSVVLEVSASSVTQFRPYFLIGDGTANRTLILSAEL